LTQDKWTFSPISGPFGLLQSDGPDNLRLLAGGKTSPPTTQPNLRLPSDVATFCGLKPISIITKGAAKAAWLKICEQTVKDADVGKCGRDGDD
jgi:hypothetical protein